MTFLLLLLEILFVSTMIVVLYRMKARFGLALLYIFIGSVQYLQAVLAAVFFISVGGFSFSPGSTILFSASLFAILLVYLEEGIPQTRTLIYGIVLSNVTLTVLSLITELQINQLSGVLNTEAVPVRLFTLNARLFTVGTVSVALDAFLIVILYDFLLFKVRRLDLFGRILVSILGVLYFDSVVFVTGAFLGSPGYQNILASHLVSKTFSGVIFSIVLWLYLAVVDRRQAGTLEDRSGKFGDVFSIITYQEKFDRLNAARARAETERELLREREQEARSEAEDATRELATTFERVADAVVALDREWRYTYVNVHAAKLLGREKPEDLIGRHIWTEYPNGTDQPFARAYREAIKTQTTIHFEDYYQPWDRWFENRIYPSPEGLTIYFTEITERKRAEMALEQSEARLRLALDAAQMGTFDWDMAENRITWSSGHELLWGYAPGEFDGTYAAFAERVHPHDLPTINDDVALAVEVPGPFAREYRVVWPDGSVHWIAGRGEFGFDSSGRPVRMRGVVFETTERRLAEDALRESEARMRLLIASSNVGLWDWNLVTNEVYFSPEWKQQLGYADHELPNRYKEWESRLHPDDRQPTLDGTRDFRESARDTHEERFRLRHKDGSWRWILTHAEMIRNESGIPLRISGCHIDITERETAYASLRAAEERFRTLVEHLQVGVLLFGHKAEILVANPKALTLLGLTEDQLIGKTSLDPDWNVIHEDGSPFPGSTHPVPQAIATGQPVRGVVMGVYRPTTEDRVWLLVDAEPQMAGDGAVKQVICTFGDITERKRAQDALQESERRFRSTLENVNLLAVALDLEGNITFCNDFFLRVTGWERDDLIGQNGLRTFLPESDREPVLTAFLRGVTTGRLAMHIEIEFVTHDGERRLIHWSNTILRDLQGETIGTVSLGQDVTESRRLMEAVQERENQLRLFVEHSPAAIAMFDREMTYIVASRRWHADYRIDDPDITGRSHYEVFPDLPEEWKESHRRCLAGAIERSEEDPYPRADGRTDWIRWEAHPWRHSNGEIGGLIIFSEVITERKEAAAELRSLNDRLQNLSRRLMEIQESERRQLARELHDEIGQTLSVTKINLQMLRRLSDPDMIGSRIDDSVAVVDRALGQVRSLSLKLRPPLLDDLGLAAALRWLVDQQTDRSGLAMEFQNEVAETRFDTAVETACFRVAQEALNNVIKHATAKKVTVELAMKDETLHLRVTDDGVGFDVEIARMRARLGRSLGILSIEERAKLVGGVVEWQSKPGKGTEVHARFPLSQLPGASREKETSR